MKLLQESVRSGVAEDTETASIESPQDINKMAVLLVEKFRQTNEKIPGFGHRYHDEDPRAPKLIKTAKKYGFYGIHTQFAVALQEIIYEQKNILINGLHIHLSGCF